MNSYQNTTILVTPQQGATNQSRQTSPHPTRGLTLLEKLHKAQTEWRKIFTQTIDVTPGSQIVNLEMFLSVDNQRLNRFWGDELKEKGDGIFLSLCIEC